MAVTLSHRFRLVPDPVVNNSLVDILGSTIANKAVTEAVPSTQHSPFCWIESPSEVVMRLVAGDFCPIPTERKSTTRMMLQPVHKYFMECLGDRDGSGRML